VVKIEEKRISFTEIESRIVQSGLAADVCVISLKNKRQYLAAAVVFNGKGKERFAGLEKHAINTFWREYLLQYFENIVIPKKWRYPETLPLDAQGKKKREEVELLFSGESAASAGGGLGAPGREKIIEKTDNSVSLEFSIPGTSPCFDGHFPGFPILPAAAQADLTLRFASQYFGTRIEISEIRKIKFSNLIRPFSPVVLTIEKKGKNISFKMNSPSGETVYSCGTMVIREKP
jgi:3-hydroxymyristoyl/3-hydroxydecanoyl-(acyl carrier protein) dehydratase